jgi:cysteine dioxygenase
MEQRQVLQERLHGNDASKSVSLKELIGQLHEAFASNDVDIDYVQDLMLAYKSNPQEWRKFAKFDRYR